MNGTTCTPPATDETGGRLPDGRVFNETGIVIADALAALSRTNLRSVTRVLLAIEILRKHLQVPTLMLEDMLDPTSAPQDKVHALSNSEELAALSAAKRARIDNTFHLVEAIEDDSATSDLLTTLDLT